MVIESASYLDDSYFVFERISEYCYQIGFTFAVKHGGLCSTFVRVPITSLASALPFVTALAQNHDALSSGSIP